jgi:hypothetical protein
MTSVKFNPNGNLGKLLKRLHQMNNQKIELGYFSEQLPHASGDDYADIMMSHGNGFMIMDYIKFDVESDLLKSNGALGKELNMFIHNPSTSTATLLDNIGNTYAHYSTYYFGNSDKLYVTFNPTPMVDTGELADNFAWRTTINTTYKTVG